MKSYDSLCYTITLTGRMSSFRKMMLWLQILCTTCQMNPLFAKKTSKIAIFTFSLISWNMLPKLQPNFLILIYFT